MLKKTMTVVACCALIGGLAASGGAVLSPPISNYTTVPPFVSLSVLPNVMILLDTSGSMNRAFDSTTFVPATDVNRGPFDQNNCYSYQASAFGGNAFVPNPSSNASAPIANCPAGYPWSGNLLNWAVVRRADITSWALYGGNCATARDSSLNCSHVRLINTFLSDRRATQTTTTTSVNQLMPNGIIPSGVNSNGNVYFHLMTGTLAGTFCVDNDSTPPSTSASNCQDSDAFVEGGPFTLIYDPIVPQSGALQSIGSRARWGAFQFKLGQGPSEGGCSGCDGGVLLAGIGTPISTLIPAFEALPFDNWTPSAETLYEVGRYFAQITPAYSGSDYSVSVGTGTDPYWFTSPTWAATSQYARCCQSFVLFMTDGQPTMDTNIPAGIQDIAHTADNHAANLPVASHHSVCSAYYGGAGADPCAALGTHYVDDVAYYLHITDLRQATIASPANNSNAGVVSLGAGNEIDPGGTTTHSVQTISTYFFLTYETFNSNLLKDAAKMGGFSIPNTGSATTNCYLMTTAAATANSCFAPTQNWQWDNVINLTGATGSDGIADNYFEADFGGSVKDQLAKVVEAILQKSASGTAASVLASSATGAGALYQAYFFPAQVVGVTTVVWTGYTQGLFVDPFGNLREDTNQDHRLVYSDDRIIKTRYDSNAGAVLVDYYVDTSPADGQADSTTPTLASQPLNSIQPIWEAGKQLALKDSSTRVINTWVDNSPHDGVVNAGEVIPFTAANAATLSPYLKADATVPYTATAIVNFVNGCDPSVCAEQSNLRGRMVQVPAGSGIYKVWKYGDAIDSTPTIVGNPSERFDLLYGDTSYTAYLQQYLNRRQVAYVGGNDGMLHAFNAGFFHDGDDPTTTPVEHGYFTTAPNDNSGTIALGDELWGFIPQAALPQLRWLAQPDYNHVYYVDLKAKITDAKVFTADANHPNGWGTVLIAGMRMGGSCANCSNGQATPMSQTADFGSGTETRYFYSTYFVLDITNPEAPPTLMWSFTDASLGLTTSYPTLIHVNPSANTKTDHSADKWFVVFGSGPSDYDAGVNSQTGTLYVVDLQAGPGTATFGPGTALSYSNVTKFTTTNACGTVAPNGECSFIGNIVALDVDLDYRTDAVYFGNTINNSSSSPYNGGALGGDNPTWKGKMYRLTTGTTSPFGSVMTPSSWGITGQKPTELLNSFPSPATKLVRPDSSAPALVLDDASNVWVFWGTGRYFSSVDKTNTETQYFFGVKDPVLTGGCTQSSATNCQKQNLVDMSNVVVCITGVGTCGGTTNQVTGGPSGVTSFGAPDSTDTTTLQGKVASMDGWFTTLPQSGERDLNSATVLGGTVFFPTYVPTNDICAATGEGFLYALYYKTGTANKESVIGTTTSGGNTNVNRSVDMGAGLSSSIAIQVGGQGSGGSGTSSGQGCAGRVTAFTQTSTGALSQACTKPAEVSWSHYVSWIPQRD